MKKIVVLLMLAIFATACGVVLPTHTPATVTVQAAAPTKAPTQAPQNTAVPAATAPAPEAPTTGPGAIVSLNYDETNGDPLTAGQTKLVALYLRDAMGASGTQTAMETAIAAIQREAATASATVKQGSSLTLPRSNAWLVWHSNADQVGKVPTDVSDVLGSLRTGKGKIWIVVPFAAGVPWPTANTFEANDGQFWAVAVH